MESSRLFSIDDQRDLNGFYLFAIMLESQLPLDLTQLSGAFYLFKNPYVLRSLAPDSWSEIKASLSEHEISNISSTLVAYSPAVLDQAFKSGVEHLAELGLLTVTRTDEKLLYSITDVPFSQISDTIRRRARMVIQVVRKLPHGAVRSEIQEALQRYGKSPSLPSSGLT